MSTVEHTKRCFHPLLSKNVSSNLTFEHLTEKYLGFVYFQDFLIKCSQALSHHKSMLALCFSIRIAIHTKVKILWSIVKYIAYFGFSCYRIPTTFTDSLRFLFRKIAYYIKVKPLNLRHLSQIFTI